MCWAPKADKGRSAMRDVPWLSVQLVPSMYLCPLFIHKDILGDPPSTELPFAEADSIYIFSACNIHTKSTLRFQ